MLYYIACYSLHKFNILSLQNLHKLIFNSLFLGKMSSALAAHASRFVDEQFSTKLLYEPAIQILENARKEGHFIAVLSSSPDFLVKLFAGRFKADAWLATSYYQDQHGCFDSISGVIDGEAKQLYAKQLSQKLGIPESEFNAYSDSYIDLPLLEAVGGPVGVNPDYKLRTVCKKKEWKII